MQLFCLIKLISNMGGEGTHNLCKLLKSLLFIVKIINTANTQLASIVSQMSLICCKTLYKPFFCPILYLQNVLVRRLLVNIYYLLITKVIIL